MDDLKLVEIARQVAQQAHCPYSHFQVGAALLTADGQVFTGCNVENASYGLTLCAERAALGSAIAAGQRQFRAIAILATRIATPCGACRQVLAEFVLPDFRVLVASLEHPADYQAFTMAALLPHPFVLENAGEEGHV